MDEIQLCCGFCAEWLHDTVLVGKCSRSGNRTEESFKCEFFAPSKFLEGVIEMHIQRGKRVLITTKSSKTGETTEKIIGRTEHPF
jgi:hypothetical protein